MKSLRWWPILSSLLVFLVYIGPELLGRIGHLLATAPGEHEGAWWVLPLLMLWLLALIWICTYELWRDRLSEGLVLRLRQVDGGSPPRRIETAAKIGREEG